MNNLRIDANGVVLTEEFRRIISDLINENDFSDSGYDTKDINLYLASKFKARRKSYYRKYRY